MNEEPNPMSEKKKGKRKMRHVTDDQQLSPSMRKRSSAKPIVPPPLPVPEKLTLENLGSTKLPTLAPVPPGPPPTVVETNLLSSRQIIGVDEQYSKDENLLNEFLRLHPMLSNEATSARTLQLVSQMIEKTSIITTPLEEVSKSYDDRQLSPADETIGERRCINESRCLGIHIAKLRFGKDTQFAFTCKEFLLPSQKAAFLNGKGLPPRRSKCLLCTRYFTNCTRFGIELVLRFAHTATQTQCC